MSQVIRKYNSGGQTDKPKLLSVKGLGDFNQDDLIKRGYRDADEYASSKGLGNTAAADFRNAVQYMLEGISNGTMTMDAMGNFQDATGQKSSTGELDRKKFLGIKTGVKNTENNAYGLAADYLYNIIKGSPQYKQPEVKKERFNANKLMEDAISREWYGGNAIDYNNWFRNRTEQDRNALMGRIWDNADYNQIFQSHDWSGTNIKSAEDLAALGRAYGAAITNNKLDNNDYNTFAALGGTGLDKFIRPTQQATAPQSSTIEGQQGKIDTNWTNSEYDRTVDDKGKYHIYKKGTNEEVSGILPGNVFQGVGNRYAFDGNIYDDSNLPEQYRQDITRARQAQLGEYTSLTDNNPFTKMLKGQGYNYITNLSQFASGVGNNVLYGAYSNPSDVNGKIGFYLKNPTTGKTTRGSVELNKSLGEYQFIGEDGNVINLGAYNPNGGRERQGAKFIDYTDTSKANWENLFNTWMQDPDLSNPASEAYRMVQNTLSKWIDSKQSPFVKYGKDYKWAVGDNDMNVTRNNDGTLSWYFNNKVESEDESSNELQRLLSIPTAERSREINDRILKLQGYKKGGVISAQLGTKFIEDTTPLKVSAIQPDAEQIERNTKARQSFTGRSNVSLGNNKDITDAGGVIKTSDKVRLGAAMADLASIGLGFVPGANLASAGVGVGASLTEFMADLASDGPQWGDLGRLGMNLGMDALSLIPVGKTLKATKALGKIKKSIPVLMTLINTTPYLDPAIRSEYNKTLSKLTKGDWGSLNTGDFKNISAIGSTLLMGKNLAKSHKGWWNSSTNPSGKRRVTAMIDGKQQTLEVDDAFFQNTKGKNQVAELRTKFAEQYNKSNKLEGDKAIKPEDVAVDTKRFGTRPQTEEVKGAESNNWLANTWLGKHMLRYKDPSIIRGNENTPFSDAWFVKKGIFNRAEGATNSRSGSKKEEAPSTSAKSSEPTKSTTLVLVPGKRNEYSSWNNEVQGYERNFRQGEAERVRQNRLKIDDSRDYRAGTIPREGSISKSEGVDAKQLRAIRKLSSFVGEIADEMAKPPIDRSKLPVPYRGPVTQIPNIRTLIGGPAINYKGISEGLERATKQRLAKDIADTRIERSVTQNTETVARRQAEDAKKNVERQIALTVAQEHPKRALTGAARRARQNSLNQAFNSRYYEVMDALRNKPNPTKQKSKKKKKTSKDDRVTKKAEGGLIQFLQGGNAVGRIKAKDMSSWNRSKALSGYDFGADVDRWKSQYTGSDDWRQAYAAAFNGGEDIYDQLTSMTGDYFGGNYNYSVQDPLAKHRQVTFRGTNQGFDDLIRKGIVGYGTTEGNSGFDVYAGDRTGNRTLGRGMSADDVARFNEQLRARGLELYDKGDGGYRLRPLQDPANELGEVVVTAPRVSNTSNPSDIRRTPGSTKKGLKLNVAPEEVLALGRMVGGLAANNRAARIYKEGLKPTLLDTFENTVPLQGNFQAVTNAEQQAGNLESVAARPRTSDASLQLAGELEASGRAGQARFQGGLQDAEMFYKTRMLGQQESDAAKARRVEVANRNRASMNAIDAAKKQIDAGRVTANYQQVIAPYLAGVENRFRQTKAMRDQLALESYLNEANSNYNTSAAKIMEDYKDDPIGAQRELSKLQKGLQSDMLKKRSSLISTPWLVQFSGKGSKLSYAERAMLQRAKDFNKRLSDDNKQFHKDIMESKREHNKMIANMSALTAALIKKGMQL